MSPFWEICIFVFSHYKNKNANFSKRARCPIFKFFLVIREVILQKMAPISAPVNFFSVLTLISHCAFPGNSPRQCEESSTTVADPTVHRIEDRGPWRPLHRLSQARGAGLSWGGLLTAAGFNLKFAMSKFISIQMNPLMMISGPTSISSDPSRPSHIWSA